MGNLEQMAAEKLLFFRKRHGTKALPSPALLRRGSEQEAFRGAAVSLKDFPEQRPPMGLALPPKTEKVIRYLLPGSRPLRGAHTAQIIPSTEHGMSTSKSSKDYKEPADHQPGGDEAILINPHRGAMEPSLSHLPTCMAQKKRPQDGLCGVLKVGDQLHRQHRKGSRAPSAQEASNGDASLLECREQLNRIPPVGSDFSVAMFLPANGADGSDEGGKINPSGEEQFLVFPNRLISVRVSKLNFSAPCMRGGRLWAAQTFGSASLQPSVILLRSISYLVNSPTLIPLVKIPRKSSTPFLHYIEGDNTSWHKGEEVRSFLRTHTRIRLAYLPPYQPGLNAEERIWRQVRYEATTNRWFESLDMIWETVQETTHSWTKVKLKRLCKIT